MIGFMVDFVRGESRSSDLKIARKAAFRFLLSELEAASLSRFNASLIIAVVCRLHRELDLHILWIPLLDPL